MSITMKRFKEFCKEATEILEKVNFEPYNIDFWNNEIWMQGHYSSELEKELVKKGFKWERSFKDTDLLFLVFRKHNVEITLVRQY